MSAPGQRDGAPARLHVRRMASLPTARAEGRTGASTPFAPGSAWRRRTILALLVAGALERIAWTATRGTWSAGGEAFLVARAIGDGRGVADAYGHLSGATAHLLPISPAIAGAAYALFGYTQAAEMVLACWSIGLAFASYLLLEGAFARLGASSGARLAALAFLCLAPTYIAQEAVDFRIWEGGLAACLSAVVLNRVTAAARGTPSARTTAALIVVAPLLVFVNPMIGAAAFVSLALLWSRQLGWRLALVRLLAALAVLAALVTPWTIRNARVMGAPVVLRSNAGLELAIAHYPGAPTRGDRYDAFVARLHAVHPLQGRAAHARMVAAGGEVAYSRALGRAAIATIAANPRHAAAIALAHIGDMITPGTWIFRIWGDALLAPIQAWLASLVGVVGLAGLALGLVSGGRRWLFVAVPVVIPILVFSPFQPVMRYIYLIYAPLTFCASYGLSALVRFARRAQH